MILTSNKAHGAFHDWLRASLDQQCTCHWPITHWCVCLLWLQIPKFLFNYVPLWRSISMTNPCQGFLGFYCITEGQCKDYLIALVFPTSNISFHIHGWLIMDTTGKGSLTWWCGPCGWFVHCQVPRAHDHPRYLNLQQNKTRLIKTMLTKCVLKNSKRGKVNDLKQKQTDKTYEQESWRGKNPSNHHFKHQLGEAHLCKYLATTKFSDWKKVITQNLKANCINDLKICPDYVLTFY